MSQVSWFVIAPVIFAAGCSSPLVRAAREGQAKEVRSLLPGERKRCGEALRAAAANNSEDSIKVLIEGGCDINSKDKDGYTPLMMAAAKGHDDSVRLLLMRKADPDLVTWNEKTAAMLAREGRHKETAQLIENLDRTLNPEVAAMVAAGKPPSAGFIDNMLDAAASGAAQNLMQQAASGRMPEMNSAVQGALRGALDPSSAQGQSAGLLNPAAQGAAGNALRGARGGSQAMLRAAAVGAASGAAQEMLSSPGEASGAEHEDIPAPTSRAQAHLAANREVPAHADSAQAFHCYLAKDDEVRETADERFSRIVTSLATCFDPRSYRLEPRGIGAVFTESGLEYGKLTPGYQAFLAPPLDTMGSLYFDFQEVTGSVVAWQEKPKGVDFIMQWRQPRNFNGTVIMSAYLRSAVKIPRRRYLWVAGVFSGEKKSFKNSYGETKEFLVVDVVAVLGFNQAIQAGMGSAAARTNEWIFTYDRGLIRKLVAGKLGPNGNHKE